MYTNLWKHKDIAKTYLGLDDYEPLTVDYIPDVFKDNVFFHKLPIRERDLAWLLEQICPHYKHKIEMPVDLSPCLKLCLCSSAFGVHRASPK